MSFPWPLWTHGLPRWTLDRGWGNQPPYPGLLPRVRRHSPHGGPGDSHAHSGFFLSTGIGTTWKILALWSSVTRVTQVGRKLPLKPTNVIFSEKQ